MRRVEGSHRVRLLVDECLALADADMLRAAGHDAIHARDLGLLGLPTPSDGRGPPQLRRSAHRAAKTRKRFSGSVFLGASCAQRAGRQCCLVDRDAVISLDELDVVR